MALFGWKKPTDGGGDKGGSSGAAGGGAGAGGFEFSPEKAARWFHHARTSHDASNFEYAMTCWLSGLRFEPNNLDAIKQFFNSAQAYNAPVSRELAKAAAGKTDVDKFLTALLNFACKLGDTDSAVRCVQAAGELSLSEIVSSLGPMALRVAFDDKRPRKDYFTRLMESFKKSGHYELAVKAGEAAHRLDPTDSKLHTEVRNLAAQGTMTRGGYENTGQEGGFRSNIRDAEKQRQLEEQERTVRTEGVADRTIATTKAEYEARPQDRPTVRKYAEALLTRGTPEDESAAIAVLTKAYQDTQEFDFRKRAGEVRLKQARRTLKQLQAAVAANPTDEGKAEASAAAQKLLELEIGEYEARVVAYPTDLIIKFELGRRYYYAGKYNEAIDLLQQAKDDVKNRSAVLSMLGSSFVAIGWHEEAVGTFRLALENHADPNDGPGMDLRYGLMCALQRHAEESKDLPSAEEAAKLAGQIAVQQISFKDVRARRDEIKALIARLKSGG